MGIQQAVGAKVEKKEPESVKFIGHYFRQKESCAHQFILVLYALKLWRHPQS